MSTLEHGQLPRPPVPAAVPARAAAAQWRWTWPIGLVVIVWAAALWTGFGALRRYSETAGPQSTAPAQWPVDASFSRDPVKPTLVMFLHPYCPCSRASVDELGVLLAKIAQRAAVRAVFSYSGVPDEGWTENALWKRAAGLPGVDVRADPGGSDTARFGSFVSGATLLYGADGRLLFEGGLTVARGHRGDSTGRAAIEALVSGQPAPLRASVFGCLFSAPTSAAAERTR